MSEQDYFRSALSDFTYEAASGGAIRHLADLGYTVKQISEKLTYPTPYERVRKTVWQHLIDTQTVRTQTPGSGNVRGKADYTVERDKYGRTSFRLTAPQDNHAEPIRWKERRYSEELNGSLAAYLAQMCAANGEEDAYISCDFGMQAGRDEEMYAAAMQTLNARQREYITGLPWEETTCYHRLDGRMREIVAKLYGAGLYRGECYFGKLREKVEIG